MALLNYLSTGTYSVIDSVVYSKMNSLLRFTLRIFSDDSKQIMLAEKTYDINGHTTYQALGGTYDSPPQGHQTGDWLVVSTTPTGVWEGRARTLALCTDAQNEEWSFWSIAPNQIFYDLSAENYFTFNPDTMARIEVFPTNDTRLWGAWFGSSVLYSEVNPTNIMKQGYLYLKTTNGFENVIDG